LIFFLVVNGDGLVDEGLSLLELPLLHEDPCEIVQQVGVVAFDPETFAQRGFRIPRRHRLVRPLRSGPLAAPVASNCRYAIPCYSGAFRRPSFEFPALQGMVPHRRGCPGSGNVNFFSRAGPVFRPPPPRKASPDGPSGPISGASIRPSHTLFVSQNHAAVRLTRPAFSAFMSAWLHGGDRGSLNPGKPAVSVTDRCVKRRGRRPCCPSVFDGLASRSLGDGRRERDET